MHKRKNIWENRRERDTAKILKYPRTAQLHSATPPYLMSFAPTNRHPTEALPSPHHLVATPSISWVVPQHWGPASQWGVNQVHTWFTNVEGGAFKDMYTYLGTPTGADITSLTEEQCVACCGEEGRDLYEAWQQALPSFDPRGNACAGGGWGVAWRATLPCTPITHPRSPLRPLTHSSFLPLLHLFMLPPSSLAHCTSQLAALSTTLAPDPGSRPGAPSHEWRTAVPCHRLKHERYTHTLLATTLCPHTPSPYCPCCFPLLLRCSGPPGSPPGGVASGTPTTAVVRQSSGGASRAVMLDLCITVVAPFVAIIVLLVALLHLALRSK